MNKLQQLIDELKVRRKSHTGNEYKNYMKDDILEQGISLGRADECDFIIQKLTLLLKEEPAKDLQEKKSHPFKCSCKQCMPEGYF